MSLNIYIVSLQAICLKALSSLSYETLNVIRKEITSVSKAMQGKLKESPVEGPLSRVEPAIMVVVCSTETEQLRPLSNFQTVVI